MLPRKLHDVSQQKTAGTVSTNEQDDSVMGTLVKSKLSSFLYRPSGEFEGVGQESKSHSNVSSPTSKAKPSRNTIGGCLASLET